MCNTNPCVIYSFQAAEAAAVASNGDIKANTGTPGKKQLPQQGNNDRDIGPFTNINRKASINNGSNSKLANDDSGLKPKHTSV